MAGPLKRATWTILLFFGVALIAALPDIVYRWRVFGGPLNTETTELHLMSVQHLLPVAQHAVQWALAAGEWGYLFPFALFGAYMLMRERKYETSILASAFLLVLLVHLSYRSLRLRDLLSLFPLVNVAVGYGVVSMLRRVRAMAHDHGSKIRLWPLLFCAGTTGWILFSLALSRWAAIDDVWKPGWASFGYMRPEHRASFDRLAELTTPGSVIGASLNAGPINLYSRRDSVRPYDSWTEDEWSIFLAAMQRRGRPVYLLDDGGVMAKFIQEDMSRHRLTPIAELSVPLFYTRDRTTGWLYRLEWDQ